MTKNFLNSQNYILGKTEKKKLLSKFFVEKIFNQFFNFLAKFSFFGKKINIDSYFLSYLLINFILLLFTIGMTKKGRIIFFFLIYVFFMSYISIKNYLFYKNKKNIKEFKKIKKNYDIKNIKDYFFSKGKTFFGKFLITIFFSILYFYLTAGFFGINMTFDMFIWIFYFIIFYIIWFGNFRFQNNKIFKLKGISIFFLPFLIIFFPLTIILSYLYTFIFKGTEGYKFLKYKPQTKFFTKFKKLDKNFAENDFYLVKLKKV